ncbi:MAG: hypothetical protein JW955_23445, partial [Sedimentisphaerales bacterium]|nr:hypothetical protein [Sedimentisphaerales bacterium]
MTTEAQVTANRLNAQKSSGPRWIESSLYRSYNELHRLRREQEAVKQSQWEEVSSSKCEVSSGADADPPCETKPIGEVSSSTPAPGGDPSRGRLGYMVDHPVCETKPIDRMEAVCSVPAMSSVETQDFASLQEEPPNGVTTSAGEGAKQDAYDKSPEVRFRPVFLGQNQGSGRPSR